jgi:NTP pyrophosphatase (non-canonical NTP hydrolase)
VIFQELDRPYREWRERNFPQNDASHQLLGMIEEVGELAHAWLKKEQGIRGTEDQHMADLKDAVGDIAIFTLGYVQLLEIKVEDVSKFYHHPSSLALKDGTVDIYIRQISKNLGRVCAWHGSGFNETSARVIGNFLGAVDAFCIRMEWSFADIVDVTGVNVLQRDWVTSPTNGEVQQQIENHQ